MLKIDNSIKRKNLPNHILEHLSFTDTDQVKFGVFGSTFVMLDLLIILPLLFPYHELSFWLTIPFLLLINLWALTMLLRKAEGLHFEFILFVGCLGAVGSLCYFILVQKIAYIVLNIHSNNFFVMSLIIYLAFFLFQIWFQNKKYCSINSDFLQFKDMPWHFKALTWSVPLGYIIAHYFISKSEVIMTTIMLLVYLMFSIFFTYVSVKFFHRYLFMKANSHFLEIPGEYKKTKKGAIH
ncbi:hypothetical protein [Fictibacillus phosphorivorans]|uniref:hypothetical protein n=1 Tax=Fictibacillus phosphorivorans TaxID=1221500 RepID=UPI0011A99E5F|nr:hypothetical protein [Fictibacillus phosphorivorans]